MSTTTKALLASYARSFLAAVLTAFLVAGGDIFAMDTTEIRNIITAGVAAVVPVLIRYLNPNDPAFGVVAEETD